MLVTIKESGAVTLMVSPICRVNLCTCNTKVVLHIYVNNLILKFDAGWVISTVTVTDVYMPYTVPLKGNVALASTILARYSNT